MKQARSSPPTAIPTKNRFEVLQAQESCFSQLQGHPKSISTKKSETQNTIVESIKKRMKYYETKQTGRLRPWLQHQKSETEARMYGQTSPPPRHTEETGNITSAAYAEKSKPSTTPLKGQAHNGLPTSHPVEDHADALASAKGGSPPSN